MFDTHMHTKISTDSKMEIEDAIKSAKEKDMGIILTEHMDLTYPREGEFIFDPEEYFSLYKKYKSDKLFLGIEIGMSSKLEEVHDIIKNYPFDYVIGSVHFVNNVDIFPKDYYEGKSKKEAFSEYFEYMIKCLKEYDFIDSLGHIDYICRYNVYEDKELYYKEFADLIDEVFKIAIFKEKGIEINTRRFNNPESVKNLQAIYKRYHELGGKIVTIGSDSHAASGVGRYVKEATELAEACGLRPVYFKNRKCDYVK